MSVSVKRVVVEGIALLRILKHCSDLQCSELHSTAVKHGNDNLHNVSGSLLGMDCDNDGTMEISYAYPFPNINNNNVDGKDYQIEMMKLLGTVNMDNNCVGWYHSIQLGNLINNEFINHQFSYQLSEELTDNSVVLVFDSSKSFLGQLVIKVFKLSNIYIEAKKNKLNKFIKPNEILEELPVTIKNYGLISAFLKDLYDHSLINVNDNNNNNIINTQYLNANVLNKSIFSIYSMNYNDLYLEKELDLMKHKIEDLIELQNPFHVYAKNTIKSRLEHVNFLNKRIQENENRKENGEDELPMNVQTIVNNNNIVISEGIKNPLPDAPARNELLLNLKQLSNYCEEINEQIKNNYRNLYLSAQITSTK